jgi:hypothetical protein
VVGRQDLAGKGGFAALSWPYKCDHWVPAEGTLEGLLIGRTRDHFMKSCILIAGFQCWLCGE